MPLLIRAEDVNGLLTIEDAIDAVEAGFREWGKNPELNAPRKRIMTPEGVRVSVHPGGIPSLGGIGVLAHSEHVADFERSSDLSQHGRTGDGSFRRQGRVVNGDPRR